MNLRTKFFFSMGLLGVLCLMLPGSLRAGTIYTYTGNAYTICSGTYCTNGPYALSITFDVLAGTPLDNLPASSYLGTDITADLTSFSITDGNGLNINQGNAPNSDYEFDIATGPSGNITSWYITANTPYYTYPEQEAISDNYQDVSSQYVSAYVGSVGANIHDPGAWSMVVTSAPEPSSNLLLGTGLLGLLALAVRSKRHTLLTSC